MKYLSLFSGVGGFEYGIGDRGECIGYSEIDKYAKEIYRRHYPNHLDLGDATTIDPDTIPDFDLLVGGFPCQAFSVAGKGRGFCDTRGTLFFEISRILEAKRPRYFLLENVKGLLSNNKGETFQTILGILTDLGYHVEWQVLNSKDFGVPQNRERVFIIGHLGRGSGRKVFPIGETTESTIIIHSRGKHQQDTVHNPKGIMSTLAGGTHGSAPHLTKIIHPTHKLKQVGNVDTKGHNSLWGRVYDPEGVSANLNAHGGGLGAKTGLYKVPSIKKIGNLNPSGKGQNGAVFDSEGLAPTVSTNKGQGSRVAVPVLTPDREKKRQNGRRFKTDGEPAFTLTQQDKHGVYDGFRIRRLTPTECERLQGFPDGWTEGISDTQRYKCLGNAVTTNVINAIIDKMYDSHLFDNKKNKEERI